MPRSFRVTGLVWAFLIALAMGLSAQETTIVLIRHAERQSIFDDDSPLSGMGQRHAELLVPLLVERKPEFLFASDRKRTQQTLAPTAAKLGLTIQLRAKSDSLALAAELLRDHRHRTAVICWHHELMKPLVRALGVTGAVPYWPLDTYDWLWIVHIPDHGEPSLETRKQTLAPAPAGSAERR